MSKVKNNILLLSAEGDLKRALRQIKGKTLVIALDEVAQYKAIAIGIAYRTVADYLRISESELRSAAHHIALRWYKVNDVDFTEFDGFFSWRVNYIDTSYVTLFELMRKIIMIQTIIEEESPAGWVLATGRNKFWEKLIASSRKSSTTISCVKPHFFRWMQLHINFKEIKLLLRRKGVDYLVRGWVSQFQRLLNTPAKIVPSNTPYIFVVDIPVTSVFETLIPVIRETMPEKRLVVSTDPRCTAALKKAGIASISFDTESLGILRGNSEWTAQEQVLATLRVNWRALETVRNTQPDPSVLFRGVNLWHFCRDDFHNYFLRRLPQAFDHYQLARAVFRAYQGCTLITASDSHYAGMLFVRAAEREGRHSLTIQHGMVNHPEGYLPLRATQMAVMGDAVKEWLTSHGADPKQLIVTGQPRFDALIQSPSIDRISLLTELGLNPKSPTWLVAPEPQLGFWMRQILFDTLNMLPDVQAVVRVHPNDNFADYKLALETYYGLKKRVCLANKYDVPSALNACDVLVFGRSTLGLEALIKNKPLIVIRPPENSGWILPPYLDDYIKNVSYLCVQKSSELLQAWQILCSVETTPLVQFIIEQIVQRYAYSRDGMSARRVFIAVRNLAQLVK